MHKDFKNNNVLELNAILKHIRLGKNHLEKVLDAKQLSELLKASKIDQEKKENIESDIQEKSGNIVLVIHTILTGSLGAVLGIFAFTGMRLPSIPVLISAIIIMIIIAFLISYSNFKITRKKANDNSIDQKITLIELEVLKTINIFYENDYKQVLSEFESLINFFTKNQPCKNASIEPHKILLIVEKYFKLHEIQLSKDQNNLLKKLRHVIEKFSYQEITLEDDKSFTKDFLQASDQNFTTHYVDALIQKKSPDILPTITRWQWMKSNVQLIITGIMPTFIGGFGSMFVLLTGIPEILEVFHIPATSFIRNESWISGLSITIALFITCYYGYSHVHSSYKQFIRLEELEQTERHITEEAAIVIKISTKVNCIIQASSILDKLVSSLISTRDI